MNKLLQMLLTLSALLLAASVAYALAIRPLVNERKTKQCLEDANVQYRERWIEYCNLERATIGTDGFCLLSEKSADNAISRLWKDKEFCINQFK